jgi:hypothetical protein
MDALESVDSSLERLDDEIAKIRAESTSILASYFKLIHGATA